MPESSKPVVAVVMGSSSDWETMQHAVTMLEQFGVAHERHIVSAHRTPVWMAEFASGAEARGIEVIIAGAGGAAHLPGMVAAHTVLPVLGVPVPGDPGPDAPKPGVNGAGADAPPGCFPSSTLMRSSRRITDSLSSVTDLIKDAIADGS